MKRDPLFAQILAKGERLEAENADLLCALEGVLPFLTGNYWPGQASDAVVDFAISVVRKAESTAEAKRKGIV